MTPSESPCEQPWRGGDGEVERKWFVQCDSHQPSFSEEWCSVVTSDCNHLSIAGVLIKHLMKQFFWLHILQHLWPGTEKPGFMLRNLALSFGEGVWCWVLWMMVSTKGVSINLWIPNHLISGKGSRWGPRQPLQEVRQECHWWGLPQFGCVAESWQCEEHSECGAWFACLVW